MLMKMSSLCRRALLQIKHMDYRLPNTVVGPSELRTRKLMKYIWQPPTPGIPFLALLKATWSHATNDYLKIKRHITQHGWDGKVR